MRKRRIERAIVLGLVLSTSIYTSAFAAEDVALPEVPNVDISVPEIPEDSEAIGNVGDSVADNTVLNISSQNDSSTERYNKSAQLTIGKDATLNLHNIVITGANIIGEDGSSLNIYLHNGVNTGGNISGIYPLENNVNINVDNLKIINEIKDENAGKGIYIYIDKDVDLNTKSLTIKSYDDGIFSIDRDSILATPPKANININSEDAINIISQNGYGIVNNSENEKLYINATADREGNKQTLKDTKSDVYIVSQNDSYIDVTEGQKSGISQRVDNDMIIQGRNIIVGGNYAGIQTQIRAGYGSAFDKFNPTYAKLEVNSNNTTYVYGNVYGLNLTRNSNVNFNSLNDNYFAALSDFSYKKSNWSGDKEIAAINSKTQENTNTTINGKNNYFVVQDNLHEDSEEAAKDFHFYGIKLGGTSATRDTNNQVLEATATGGYNVVSSPEYAIYADKKSSVKLTFDMGNMISGAVVASGNDTGSTTNSVSNASISINGNTNTVNSLTEVAMQDGGTVTDGTGDVQKENHVISAVYVKNGGNVDITGNTQNIIATQADTANDTVASETKERTIWAEDGTININGLTSIHASNGSIDDTNSVGVALAAGASRVEEGNPEEETKPFSGVINANLADGSYIYGDMLAGNGGLLNIYKGAGISTFADGGTDSGEPINNAVIQGNALSANGGEVNLKLGTNTYWQGRADDYQDADNPEWNQQHAGVFAPEFSNSIESSGNVNVELDGATWEVTGQSWVTSVSGNGGTIDLSATPTDRSTETHAMHIGNLTGNHNFVVNLDKEHSVSDMLYIYNVGEGAGDTNTYTQHVIINDIKGIENIADGEKLRFATVMPGVDNLYFTGEYEEGRLPNDTVNGATNGTSRAKMSARAAVPNVAMFRDAGAMNNSFLIKNENYSTADAENTGYNGEQFDEVKPGNEYIDTNYEDGINWYLQRNKAGDEVSDSGNTILNMSRANYSQAVYLDRLNKRLGEARYIDGDEGLWVRMRHDKIDKDTGFEITTNMYELGYDKYKESKDKKGYHRQGVAIDYMDGDTDYKDVNGSGETNRKGIWLYDTWFGNKGHYTDYVFKWGHLENSFEFFTKSRGEKVNGDYNNNVYSLSAEWGYKDILDEDKENPENNKEKWYIEPQLQLQYARVTGADYTTSQGTDVSLDGIDSLIGRAGFRLGKDFGKEKKSTFYIKADILHEFLGDQDISVRDRTTGGQFMDWRYENEGTWYDVGLGFSTMLSDHSYAYLDVEKIFGGDNDNSYQINGGFEWKL